MRRAIYIAGVSLCFGSAVALYRAGTKPEALSAGQALRATAEKRCVPPQAESDVVKAKTSPAMTDSPHEGIATAPDFNAGNSLTEALARARPELERCLSAVRATIARTSGDGLRERLEALDALPPVLGPVDRYALYIFLLDVNRTDDLTADQERVLVNDIMKLLRCQSDGAPELGAVLTAVYRNKNQDSVIRDYAIQHLGSWFENYTSNKEIESVLWEAAQETQGTVSGAALLSLSRLSRVNPEVKIADIGAAAIRLAENNGASVAARATALAVAADALGHEALPLARRLAVESNSLMLRFAAIGVMGELGSAEDIAFLRNLAEACGSECRPGIEVAIAKLNSR